MTGVVVVLALLLAPGMQDPHAAHGEGDHRNHHHPAPAGDAHIIVTINPEARVSAVRAGSPEPGICGQPQDLRVRVVNQGFVTAPLRVALAGDGAANAELRADGAQLSGADEERVLQLVPKGPAPVDLTIVFAVSDEVGDLGMRDRVHLYLRCLP